MEYQVHVGFGFHVNCYHSYRGDTCDTLGFGGDIRTIRYLLDTLDRFNEMGVPVKGTWDFENAYSLEEILPKYAPDIIERVKERQHVYGDENILMGYNNGAMSAMTKDEFMASVQWAISNEQGSGLEDIFGACERIIRPQEVMFTPSEAALYQQAGIHTVCLYYSCIPFDAFRTIIPQLSDEAAFNPLSYRYQEGTVNILPTYSQADLMDAGSLKKLVHQLHEKQRKGNIKRDVFVFINIDADSFLWEPFPVPRVLRKVPNFNGLEGLIQEIRELQYVVFDTPGQYLKGHDAVQDIFFGEDVADGNYSGYSSWAEKPFNRLIWTRLERSRMYANLYKQDCLSPSFAERVRLLSTTHFGLASPVLNITREKKALALSDYMVHKEEIALLEKWELKSHKIKKNEVWLKNRNDSSLINMQLVLAPEFCEDVETLKLKGEGLEHYAVVETERWEDGSIKHIYCVCRFQKVKKKYRITFHVAQADKKKKVKKIRSAIRDIDNTLMIIDEETGFPEFFAEDGNKIAFWSSWIRYEGKQYGFERPTINNLEIAGEGQGMMLQGKIYLPCEKESGAYTFAIFHMKGEQGFFLLSKIQYPYTEETTEITTQAYNLGRFCDLGWEEVAPMELIGQYHDDVNVLKRNFMEDMSSYPLADFWTAIPENDNIDSFNHQLSGGVLAIEDHEKGLLLSHARQVLGSMAHNPMRMIHKKDIREVHLNPFGTYDGAQRTYPSRGNGAMMDIYQTIMPQAKSLAPAYNGAFELTAQWISDRKQVDDKKMNDRRAFADGCVVYTTSGAIERYKEDNVRLHEARCVEVRPLEATKLLPEGINVIKIYNMLKKYLQNIKFT